MLFFVVDENLNYYCLVMKLILLFISACLASSSLFAQYYFTDIVANAQSSTQYKLLTDAKVKLVKAINYDEKGNVIADLGIEQSIIDGGKKIITKTSIPNSSASTLENNYTDGKLISSTNNNMQTFTTLSTTTTYSYNDKGSIASINSTSTDTAAATGFLAERHTWLYNEKGSPTLMYKIKGQKDTLKVVFTYDEKGNVADERWMKKGQMTEKYYYYYNDIGLLTDVVRFNDRVRKLLPDFVYEYDADANMTKMTQAIMGGTDYLIWEYTYNDKGLKETETCYNRKKQLQGKVVFEYSY